MVVLVLVAFGALVNAIEEYNVGLAAPLIASQWSYPTPASNAPAWGCSPR